MRRMLEMSATHSTSKPQNSFLLLLLVQCATKRIERENYVNRRKSFSTLRNIISLGSKIKLKRWKYNHDDDRNLHFLVRREKLFLATPKIDHAGSVFWASKLTVRAHSDCRSDWRSPNINKPHRFPIRMQKVHSSSIIKFARKEREMSEGRHEGQKTYEKWICTNANSIFPYQVAFQKKKYSTSKLLA